MWLSGRLRLAIPSPGPAEPAAIAQRFHRGIDLERVADAGSMKRLMRPATCGTGNRRRTVRRCGAASPNPDHPHAGDENSAPHTIRISMVWPNPAPSPAATPAQQQRQRDRGRWHFRPPRRIPRTARPPARRRPAGGFRRLDVDADEGNPAARALTSGPNSSVATISTIETANTISAVRRICRGDRNEIAISTKKAGSRNSTCRLKKWNGSSPMRVATGGSPPATE